MTVKIFGFLRIFFIIYKLFYQESPFWKSQYMWRHIMMTAILPWKYPTSVFPMKFVVSRVHVQKIMAPLSVWRFEQNHSLVSYRRLPINFFSSFFRKKLQQQRSMDIEEEDNGWSSYLFICHHGILFLVTVNWIWLTTGTSNPICCHHGKGRWRSNMVLLL